MKFSHSIVLGEVLGPPRSVIDLDVLQGSQIKIFSKLGFVRVKVLVLAHTPCIDVILIICFILLLNRICNPLVIILQDRLTL